MKIVIFGLTITSSWGNGHATVWRSLCRHLIARGHEIVFFEHDLPYYAAHRDLSELAGGRLHLYQSWNEIVHQAREALRSAEVAIVSSYCPDAIAATELVWSSSVRRIFYDLDSPVTLAHLRAGESVPYIHPLGLANFDLVLSFTGGAALHALKSELGAREAVALYGSVDPDAHCAQPASDRYRASLSYLGTYSADRQQTLQKLFLEPARQLPEQRFLIGGTQYPPEFPWLPNIFFLQHLPPSRHPEFYCSSRLTLNVTRAAMREMGWCPSGRLFEAAACGVPLISDWWEGLDDFFQPGMEILVAQTAADVIRALELSDAELRRIATAARERVLAEQTGAERAREFEEILETAGARELASA